VWVREHGGGRCWRERATRAGRLPARAHGLWLEQLKAISVTLGLAVGMTTLIAYLVKRLLGGLRPSEEVETVGLDLVEHGEESYHLA
jgi:ammonia channel protein AmtB